MLCARLRLVTHSGKAEHIFVLVSAGSLDKSSSSLSKDPFYYFSHL